MRVLRHLTTESVWLLGIQFDDSSATSQLLHGLPESLVQLHLIHYWGKSDTVDSADPSSFYPQFPNAWGMLEFYDNVFLNLHGDCLLRLRNLEEVVLGLHPPRPSPTEAASVESDQTPPKTVLALHQKFQSLFSRVGVRFSVVEAEIAHAKLCSSWASELG